MNYGKKIDAYKELRNVIAHNDYDNPATERTRKLKLIAKIEITGNIIQPITDPEILKAAITDYDDFITSIVEATGNKLYSA